MYACSRLVATDVALSVICMSICGFVTRMYCAKTAEPMEMPFDGLTHVGPRNHALDGVKVGRIHSQLRGVTSR